MFLAEVGIALVDYNLKNKIRELRNIYTNINLFKTYTSNQLIRVV